MSNSVSWLVELAVKPGELENFRALMQEKVESTETEQGTLSYGTPSDEVKEALSGFCPVFMAPFGGFTRSESRQGGGS